MTTIDPASFVIETEPPSRRPQPVVRQAQSRHRHSPAMPIRISEKRILRWLLIVACAVFIWDRIEPRPTVVKFMTPAEMRKLQSINRANNEQARADPPNFDRAFGGERW